ncbi:MAG TPA: lipid II flippase MurJ [Bryobacteraceae bacterium]|nr:lipid II flippase MurJ [Bryobacteraceae bacterium]
MQGGLVVGAGILLGNVTGFFRVAVTAYLLGTHAGADALATAIGPMDVLNSAIVNTMLFAFVPMLVLRASGDRAALFARAGRIFASIAAGITVFTALLAPQLIAVLGPGLAAPQRAQAAMLLRWLAPSTFFGTAAAIYSALLYTDRRFAVPSLYQTCLNGATIAGALLLRRSLGIAGFAIGYTAGSALQLFLAWLSSRNLRARAAAAPHRDSPIPVAEVLHGPGMFLLYASLIASNLVVTRIFATHAGSGMAAAFDYSMRCSSVVLAYLVYPVAATLVPEIARLRGLHEIPRAYALIDNSVVLMAVAAVASCAIGIALRTPIIALIFQHGNFTAESTRLVSTVFLGFAPSLIGWALLDLIARCFFAMNRPRLPVAAAFIPITLNLAIMSILRAEGKLTNPVVLGMGSSIGLLAGFGALFTMIHVKRLSAASDQPSAKTAWADR